MSIIRVDMTVSLDGYVTGPDDGPGAPMGTGGFRLFNWLDKRNDPGSSGEMVAEAMATRALISGRRTYELAGHWGGDHHNGVPIFVLTHTPLWWSPPGTVHFVTDAAECAALARTAVGDGVAMVHGAGSAQALLRAGEVDELELHVVPVLLGRGRRLFEHHDHVELELLRELRTREVDDPRQHVLHLRYRVRPS
ncbi:dihydrofolate reductase family protein [Actinoplanes sp. CA-054009]